jgi:hypothetical protein
MVVNRFLFFIIKGLAILVQLVAVVFYLAFILDSKLTDNLQLTRINKNNFFDLCDILNCETNGTLLKSILNVISFGIFYIQYLVFSNKNSIFMFKTELKEIASYITPISHISKMIFK